MILNTDADPLNGRDIPENLGSPLFLTKLNGAVALKVAAYHHVLQKTVTTPRILTEGS